MIRALVFLMFALAAGCSDLIDHPEVCGNGVIDPGEDCDNTTEQCDDTCRLLCNMTQTDADCAAAGTAYRCGADLVCHAPSGVFNLEPVSQFNYDVGQGSIADLDGDKIGDVVGFSDVNIDVRFGDRDGSFATRATAIVPFANTNIELRRQTADPMERTAYPADIILPTADGIAGFTSRNKRLVSIPFTNNPSVRGDCATANQTALPTESFSIDKHHLAFVSRYFENQPKGGQLVLNVLDPVAGAECQHLDLGITAPDQQLGSTIFIDHYELPSTSTTFSAMIAVGSSATATGATASVAVVRFDDVSGIFSFGTLQSFTVANRPFAFARAADPTDALAEQCPSLYFVKSDSSGVQYLAGKTVATKCTMDPVSRATPFGPNMFPTGHVPIVPRPTGVAADLLAVVTIHGLGGVTEFYRVDGGAPLLPALFQSSRPMYPIRSADIDGNGTVEALGIVGSKLGNEPDIEVLYRANTPSIAFIPYRIPTATGPTFLELGDFDGNGITDIAYTEKLTDRSPLMICYGTPDRPLDPVEIATFTDIEALSLIDVPDSNEPPAPNAPTVLDDLMVIDVLALDPAHPAIKTPLLALLHGNPQRSMFAYFDPRPDAHAGKRPSTLFVGAVTGNFVPSTKAPDLMALERSAVGTTETFTIWTAAGSDATRGFLDDNNTLSSTATTKLALSSCPPGNVADSDRPLCLASAQFVPWSVGGRDVVIAGDGPSFGADTRPRYLFTIDPKATEPVKINLGAPLESMGPVVSMWAGDVREDGKKQLVIAMPVLRFLGQNGDSSVKLCDVDDAGNVTGCDNLTDLVPELKDFKCGGAETGRIADASRFGGGTLGPQGFLAMCNDDKGTYVFHVHMRDGALVADLRLKTPETYLFLSVGDINGDGADDIGGIRVDSAGTPIVTVYTQCDSHDTKCISTSTTVLDQEQPPK